MSYTATEVHQSFASLLHAPESEEVRVYLKDKACQKLTYLENHLIADQQFLMGDSFTIADSYLYIVLSWTTRLPDGVLDLAAWPRVQAYFERIGSLENVKAARSRMESGPQTVL
jgi:glutathione S-transferase